MSKDQDNDLPTAALEAHFHKIIELVGEDPSREGLIKTPHRAAQSILDLTSGYREDLEVLVNEAIYRSDCNNKVLIQNIEFYSTCEHHLLPIIGSCDIEYLPNGKVLGLSKFARIVDMFARRLQIQENFTIQIADCIQQLLQPKAIRVQVKAKHMCMSMRGVEKQLPQMVTEHTIGDFNKR